MKIDTNIASKNMVLQMSAFRNIPRGARDIPDNEQYFWNVLLLILQNIYE